ncbi:MAG: hypothetical protein KF830_03160 [Planctomycetes bacterium]|nr:hypothetical protein [Planctomycetota bacterium]
MRTVPVTLWAKDGAGLDATEGPLRLLVPTDRKRSRSLRLLRRIDVLALPERRS